MLRATTSNGATAPSISTRVAPVSLHTRALAHVHPPTADIHVIYSFCNIKGPGHGPLWCNRLPCLHPKQSPEPAHGPGSCVNLHSPVIGSKAVYCMHHQPLANAIRAGRTLCAPCTPPPLCTVECPSTPTPWLGRPAFLATHPAASCQRGPTQQCHSLLGSCEVSDRFCLVASLVLDLTTLLLLQADPLAHSALAPYSSTVGRGCKQTSWVVMVQFGMSACALPCLLCSGQISVHGLVNVSCCACCPGVLRKRKRPAATCIQMSD